MEDRCFLFCPNCKTEHFYKAGEIIQCTCGDCIEVEEGVRSLVIALNNAGFPTYMSCQGGDGEFLFPYPWVILRFKGDGERLQLLLSSCSIRTLWCVKQYIYPNVLNALWIVPKNKAESWDALYKDANRLAKILSQQPVPSR